MAQPGPGALREAGSLRSFTYFRPRGTELAQCGEEFSQALGVYAIFDLDKHGTAIPCRLDGDDRFRPMVRGRQIAGRILRQPPVESEEQRHRLTDGRDHQRRGDAGA